MRKIITAGLTALAIGAGIAGPVVADASSTGSHSRSGGLPPYFHKVAPSWCAEDMTCWIGSKADGRSDKVSLKDWDYQMRHGHVYEGPKSQLVDVYLKKGRTDGNPLTTVRGAIKDVRNCKGKGYSRTCTAKVAGVKGRVYVAGVDFSKAR